MAQLYFVSITMTVVANVVYHLAQKSISPQIHPLFSLALTYLTALVATLVLIPFFVSRHEPLRTQLGYPTWATFVLGFAVVLLEIGFLLAYRAGWNVSLAAVTSTVIVGIILVPIGLLFFREHLSVQNGIGIVLALAGLYLMNQR